MTLERLCKGNYKLKGVIIVLPPIPINRRSPQVRKVPAVNNPGKHPLISAAGNTHVAQTAALKVDAFTQIFQFSTHDGKPPMAGNSVVIKMVI